MYSERHRGGFEKLVPKRFNLCLLLLLQVHDQMVEIFDNPDAVMTKFVQVVIDRVLQVIYS